MDFGRIPEIFSAVGGTAVLLSGAGVNALPPNEHREPIEHHQHVEVPDYQMPVFVMNATITSTASPDV